MFGNWEYVKELSGYAKNRRAMTHREKRGQWQPAQTTHSWIWGLNWNPIWLYLDSLIFSFCDLYEYKAESPNFAIFVPVQLLTWWTTMQSWHTDRFLIMRGRCSPIQFLKILHLLAKWRVVKNRNLQSWITGIFAILQEMLRSIWGLIWITLAIMKHAKYATF